jgi:hypothetical protein
VKECSHVPRSLCMLPRAPTPSTRKLSFLIGVWKPCFPFPAYHWLKHINKRGTKDGERKHTSHAKGNGLIVNKRVQQSHERNVLLDNNASSVGRKTREYMIQVARVAPSGNIMYLPFRDQNEILYTSA